MNGAAIGTVWPSNIDHNIEQADSGRVDDGQTNSVLFHLSVWPSNVVPSTPKMMYIVLDIYKMLYVVCHNMKCRSSTRVDPGVDDAS